MNDISLIPLAIHLHMADTLSGFQYEQEGKVGLGFDSINQ